MTDSTRSINAPATNAQPPVGSAGKLREQQLVLAFIGVLLVVFATALDTKLLGLIEPNPKLLWGSTLVGGMGGALLWLPVFWHSWPRGVRGMKGWPMFGAQLILAMVLGGMIVMLLSARTQDLEKPLRATWNRERAKFERASDGYPVIEQLGRQYGVDVELADEDARYQTTTHVGPNASPGQMEIYPGYCELGIWPVAVAREFPIRPGDSSVSVERMLLGVAVHELGHCLDMSRDQPTFGDPHVGVASIAPADRAKVHDLKTYLRATKQPPTKLWRELYADLFAIGYARLQWRDAGSFNDALLEERVLHEKEDPVHATACWDRWAMKQTPPANVLELRVWADTMRSSAPCTMPAR